jgi:hypothetical protein
MPLVIQTFFSLFFIANFPLFCQKGKSLVLTAQPFLFSFWGETPKAREPLLWTHQLTNNQLTPEELKYSRHSARWRQRPTNNLLEVWQNSAIFVADQLVLSLRRC